MADGTRDFPGGAGQNARSEGNDLRELGDKGMVPGKRHIERISREVDGADIFLYKNTRRG